MAHFSSAPVYSIVIELGFITKVLGYLIMSIIFSVLVIIVPFFLIGVWVRVENIVRFCPPPI